MTQTTFGYDSEQDRLWMMYSSDQPRIWITRRLAQGIAGSLMQLIEKTTMGLAGDSPGKRAEIEHRMAVRETPDGAVRQYPYQVRTESKEALHAQGFVLCTVLNANIHSGGGQITFGSEQGQVKFDFNRYDLHVWLRAIRMVITEANWNLSPSLPAWLDEPLLPSSIQNLLNSPLPPDLDADPAP
ncbi:MAG: hypothetical protein QM533_07845 [Cytophagales bacterium]|nr:hypothetical protein [Cytophagales bacterium]